MLDKTIKQAHSVDVAIPNSHSLHSTITEKLQKCTDWKEALISIRQLKSVCVIPLALSTAGVTANRLHDSLKLLNLRAAMYILMQKAAILSICRTVRTSLAEQ
jgi:hypothetical protein